jgi:hypothetical protein
MPGYNRYMPSGLTRWLPTMLGGLLAVATVMAYELDLITRDDTPRECPTAAPDPAKPVARDPLFAGSRPPSTSRRADAETEHDGAALEDRLALLEAQNQILAERSVTGELSYYDFTPAELAAMARHCDVRVDYPTFLGEQEAEDLGLEPAEREAWGRALENFAAQELDYYRDILREVAPDTPGVDELPLEEVRRKLTKIVGRAKLEGEDVQRQVAEERAGLRAAPDDPAALSAWNRYNRLRFNAGDRFAQLLGDELGEERAHELRGALGGWPGARTRQVGCE